MVSLTLHSNVLVCFQSYSWLRMCHYMQVCKISALPWICKCCIFTCVMILDQLYSTGHFKFPQLYFILVQFYATLICTPS